MHTLDDRYELDSPIGVGGSANVYLAVQRSIGRKVAIKVLRPDAVANEQAREGYLREGALLAALKHPNIVTVHDVGFTEEGLPYFVMEYVRGNSLATHLQEGRRLAPSVAMPLFEQIAAGLGHAHRHGILHRDIKPGNVLIEEASVGQWFAKLTDFGVATHEAEEQDGGLVYGTPTYMAPERFHGQPATKESDLYGLGVVMFRALAGQAPFAGATWIDTATKHANDPVPRFADLGVHDVSPELEGIVRRCLEKNPAARYWSAEELRQDLEATRLGLLEPGSVPGGVYLLEDPQPDRPVVAKQWSWSGAAAGLLVVLLIGVPVVGSVAMMRQSERNADASGQAAADEAELDALEGAPFPLAPLSAWGKADDEAEPPPSPRPRSPRPREAPEEEAPPPEAEEVVFEPPPMPKPLEDGERFLGTWEGRANNRRLTLVLSNTSDRVHGSWRNESVAGRWWWENDAVHVDVVTASRSHRLVGEVSTSGGAGEVIVRGKAKGTWSVGR